MSLKTMHLRKLKTAFPRVVLLDSVVHSILRTRVLTLWRPTSITASIKYVFFGSNTVFHRASISSACDNWYFENWLQKV